MRRRREKELELEAKIKKKDRDRDKNIEIKTMLPSIVHFSNAPGGCGKEQGAGSSVHVFHISDRNPILESLLPSLRVFMGRKLNQELELGVRLRYFNMRHVHINWHLNYQV